MPDLLICFQDNHSPMMYSFNELGGHFVGQICCILEFKNSVYAFLNLRFIIVQIMIEEIA